MRICWGVKKSGFASGAPDMLALLLLVVFFSNLGVAEPARQRAAAAAVAVIAARKLTELGDESRAAGEVTRAYLLYAEAAKRDESKAEYREKRDALAPLVAVLKRSGLEKVSIKRDLEEAERDARAQLQSARDEADRRPAAVASVFVPFTAAPEAEIPPKLEAPSPLHFNYKAQVLTYGTYSGLRTNGVFNPGNLLAGLPYEDFHLAVRPDLSLKYSIFSFSAKPRLDYDQPAQGSSGYTRAYMQEWQARVQPLPSLSFSYGREVLMWGPAMSAPASNPFFNDNGRNTPLLEVGGRDFARAVWQPGSHWAFSYIANTRLGRGEQGTLPFRPTGAVKVDYVGSSFLASGIYSNTAAQPFGAGKFVGGYLQQTVGQALRLYVEGSATDGSPLASATPLAGGFGWTWTQARLNGPLRPRTIIGGTAYTDVKGGTWTGEYIYNPAGYDALFAGNYFGLAQDASAAFLQQASYTAQAAAYLAEARDPGAGLLLRRHYAFGQYQRNDLFRHLDLVLRYTLSINDRGGQAVAFFTWNAGNHLQLFALFAGLNGSAETEFARYLHYQAQLGVRVFIH